MKHISGISEILSKYHYYIFDMSGVLTDGEVIFPGAVRCLKQLQKSGKDVIVLSNSPRVPDSIRQKLAAAGVFIDKVVTSGGFLLSDLKNPRYYPNISGKCFKIGDNENAIFEQKDVQFNLVSNLHDAEYILINKFLNDVQEFDECIDILKKSLELKLPCVCPNPDVVVYHGSKVIYPQGYIAEKYEEMGGNVYYYGKPYVSVYKYLNELYGIEKHSSIMVGDNLFTDIKGAISYGIHSLLITSGNHRADDVETLVKQYQLEPNYIASYVDY